MAEKDSAHGLILFNVADRDMVNFWIGAPHESLLPGDKFRAAVAEQAADAYAWAMLQYGPALGPPPALQQLATFLSAEYKDPVHASQLVLNAGATQSLFNLLTWLTDAQTLIFIEDPTYFAFLHVLRDHRVPAERIIAIPTDADGARIDILAEKLAKLAGDTAPSDPLKDGAAARFLYYTVAAFANPTGVSLAPERAEQLVALSEKYGMVVVSDDVYPLLYYPPLEAPPRRLFSYSDRERGLVLSNGSCSKILGPGLRVGWVEASTAMVRRISKAGLFGSGGGVSQGMGWILGRMIANGSVAAHLRQLRAEYGSRVARMADYLEANLDPAQVRFRRPQGGYFFWLELPSDVSTSALLRALQQAWARESGGAATSASHISRAVGAGSDNAPVLVRGRPLTTVEKVIFAPGSEFSIHGNFDNCLRLSFSFYDDATLQRGLERLCRVLGGVLSGSA